VRGEKEGGAEYRVVRSQDEKIAQDVECSGLEGINRKE